MSRGTTWERNGRVVNVANDEAERYGCCLGVHRRVGLMVMVAFVVRGEQIDDSKQLLGVYDRRDGTIAVIFPQPMLTVHLYYLCRVI